MGPLAAAPLLALLLAAPDLMDDGIKALDEQKYEQAVEIFTKAVAGDAKDYAAHFHLALSLSLANREPEAIPEYKKTLELKPGLYQAELNLGILLIKAKQPAQSVPHLEAAVEKKPNEFRPVFYLAQAYFDSGDYQKAGESYLKATQIDGKSASAYLGLAHSKAAQNQLAEAEPHFRKAAELDSSYRDALLELASLLEKSGKTQEAVEIYKQFPENIAARERIGALLLASKQYADAIPQLEQAVAKDPTPANRIALAKAYRLNKQLDKAQPLLEQALAAEPQNFDLNMMYGDVLSVQGKYVPSAQFYFKATQLKPDSVEAWNELAAALVLAQNYPQALAALDRVKALGGEKAGHHFLRAIMLDKMKQYKPALDSYEKFLAGSQGQNPDQEFQARQRVRIIKKELNKR